MAFDTALIAASAGIRKAVGLGEKAIEPLVQALWFHRDLPPDRNGKVKTSRNLAG